MSPTPEKKYATSQQLNIPDIEKNILAKWQAEHTFEEGLRLRENATPFVFYEGPPGANGTPGIHHVISRTIKDLFCRYKSQQGFFVARNAGWDTHGLPVELNVEKSLGITKEDIGKTISVADYNARCKADVFTFKKKWEELSRIMGYWVDMDHPYITYETKYIESLWWVIKQLHEKNLLYKSPSIQPYSPAAGTALSTHELNQPGTYKNVKDTSMTAMFKLLGEEKQDNEQARKSLEKIKKQIGDNSDIFLLAWTTTPWTLPSNLGLAIGRDISYALVCTLNPYTHEKNYVVLAEALMEKYLPTWDGHEDIAGGVKNNKIPFKKLATLSAEDLAFLRYEQLIAGALPKSGDPFRVLVGDFVSTEDGTGIVHIAPAFGADDAQLGKAYNLGMLTLVDKQGKFSDEAGEWAGRYVKNYTDDKNYIDVNVDICVSLKKRGRAFRIEKYEHNYPHCWRTGKPILYYPVDSWFVRVTAKKDRLVALNQTIHWKPASVGTGRFGKWLENVQDWNLSRSRFWGTPLPIWRTKSGEQEICVGSIKELRELAEQARELNTPEVLDALANPDTLDLHKPFVDSIILRANNGEAMRRENDLVDVWFDSGAMPYARWHYPFENVENCKHTFPADYICEGIDQTRGWFYTLHVLAVLLFDQIAFKNCVVNGHILDKHGEKMSKRLGNTIDPFETIYTLGADPTRWYMITNAPVWDNLKFDVEGVREVQRKFFGTLWNTYQFFALYANIDGFRYAEKKIAYSERPVMDRWIISRLHSVIKKVTRALDDYDATAAYREVETFCIDELSNWYVRICRRRFWKSSYEKDKISAYQTLYECLETLALLIAPVVPFCAEWLFDNLNKVSARYEVKSVHHTDFPRFDSAYIDEDLERQMQLAQQVSSCALAVRKTHNIKVRQPLRTMLIPADEQTKKHLQKVEDIILHETNIKQIIYPEGTEDFLKKTMKVNFAVLGKKMGAKIKLITQAIALCTSAHILTLEKTNALVLDLSDGSQVTLTPEDVLIQTEDMEGWAVGMKAGVWVALDTNIDAELQEEGDARELVNKIQNLRKQKDFLVTDSVRLICVHNVRLEPVIRKHEQYLCSELLCAGIDFVDTLDNFDTLDINGTALQIQIQKA